MFYTLSGLKKVQIIVRMVEFADTLALEANAERREGSSPSTGKELPWWNS